MTDRDKIRIKVSTNRLTFTWLIYQLSVRGLKTNRSDFSAILAGTRNGEKVDAIIATANEILDYYEKCFPNS